MPFDREKHHRRSIRLKGFDYTRGNAFFVTICSYQKECIFGSIADGAMVLNEQGKRVQSAWLETAAKRHSIQLDEFVVMPNHFHGIIWILDPRRGMACRAPNARLATDAYVVHDACRSPETVSMVRDRSVQYGHGTPCPYDPNSAPTTDLNSERFGRPVSGSLPTIIRSFKSAAGKYLNEARDSLGAPVWQRNYYEHIIRDDDELLRTREYIRGNPENWQSDEEYSLA